MTDYPLARFVSSLSPDAATRFDFHDPDHTSTDRASWVWQPGGLLGEPDSINPEYGLGSLSLELQVHTSHADALRIMAALGRELRRGRNFLMFQFDQWSPPGWLEVYPSSPGALGFPYAKPGTDDSVWIIPVGLTTSGTILGAQESFTVTINNDPAVVDGLAVTLQEIGGDAPAPLVVDLAADVSGLQPLLAVTPHDSAWPGLRFWQAESWTLGTDAAVAADATASGGSRVTVDFGTDETSVVRLTGAVTPTLAGTYRLFVRAYRASSSFTITGAGSALVSSEAQELSGTTGWRFVDLGLYAFPKWNTPTEPGYTLVPSTGLNDVEVKASRDGVGSLYLDYIVAIPTDLPVDGAGPSRMMDFQSALIDTIRLDGETGRLLTFTGGGDMRASEPVELHGDFPSVTPGATNVLHLLRRSAASSSDDIADSTVVTLSWRPRHVYLPGA